MFYTTLQQYLLQIKKRQDNTNTNIHRYYQYLQELLLPSFKQFQHYADNNKNNNINNNAEFYRTIAQLWTRLGLFRLHMLLPNHSIDPSAKYAVKWVYLQELMVNIDREILTRKQIEMLLVTGKIVLSQ